MASFYGKEIRAIDHKGRLSLSSSMRCGGEKEPLKTFQILRGLDGCIWLYPPGEFKKIEDVLQRRPIWDRQARLLKRMFLLDSEPVTCDGQGRILLTNDLLEWASLKAKENAMVYGQGDHIEIWNVDRFHEHLKTSPAGLEQLMAEVFKDERS
jgi:MraZ protein